ncbi:hypothetical protein [Catellatospora tritici]|uniref:hypothetical protein n=1 Tax=Catellatospora tritici TaxID=2851566 RepID=UPI001C2D7578|nr:hypothetical protein [Catellatospora tritici]MBV1849068.1 hypothetical protein [Catellatospora tritici]
MIAISGQVLAGEAEQPTRGMLAAMDSELPDGWSLERIRQVSGAEDAVALSTDRPVSYREPGSDDVPLQPDLALGFDGLCLVRVDGDGWYMGSVLADGSVVCWARYGDDLYEALRGL